MRFFRGLVVLASILIHSSTAFSAKAENDVTLMALGGPDDSFNILAIQGIENAHEDFSFSSQILSFPFQSMSSTSGRMTADIRSSGTKFFIGVGFFFSESAIESATRYPDVKFAVVDDPVNLFLNPPLPNLWSSDFATEEPSFLAGYLAAASSTTKIIAVYGGVPIPPVLRFMAGFKQGVDYYNEQNQDNVTLLETFAEEEPFSFESGVVIGKQFIAQGADRIFPVAGAGFFGVLAAVQEENAEHVRLIGVDIDAAQAVPDSAHLILTSVVKNVTLAVEEAIEWFVDSGEPGQIYIGTLENGGTFLAPLNPEVSSYQATLDELAQKIIDGEITIELPF